MQILINIDVGDLDRAVEFYVTAMPLRLSRRLFDGEIAELLGASSRIYLLQKAPGTPATAGGECRRSYGRHWTPVHLDFVVEDIDAAASRAVSAGARQEAPVQDFPGGRLVTLSDPFGNGFCLLEFEGGIIYGFPLEGSGDMNQKPIAAGKSSFDLVDPEKVFAELRLQPDTAFLDAACGPGNYCLAAAEFIGPEGAIHAVDLWEEGIAALRDRIDELALTQIHAEVGDVSRRLPVDDAAIDVVLLATVLHDLVVDGTAQGTLREIVRVLKPQGRLVIIEFDKVESEPGPPVAIRLSPAEVEEIVSPYGFCPERIEAAGPTTYLISFRAV